MLYNGEASATFHAMANMTPEDLETWRQHLLKYCGLDTFAMVKVWERLNHIVRSDIPLNELNLVTQ